MPENPIFTPNDGWNWQIAKTFVEIADGNILRRIEILPDLSADEDNAAPGDDGLAQVVVELLLGISVACVEFADSSMHM